MSNQSHQNTFEIAIASSFTIEPIRNVIDFWADEFQLSHHLSFAPFQQILQCLVSTDSLFAENRNGVNLVFLRLEDCWPEQESSEGGFHQMDAFIDDLEKALVVAEQNHHVPLILTICPRSTNYQKNKDYFYFIQSKHERITQIIEKFSNVYCIAEHEIFDLYPLEDYEDNFAYQQGKIPYTKECFTALGTIASRKIAALIRKPYKALILDCDNTLWKGICAEDGLENIVVDENYRTLQNYIIKLQEQGFLLCLCSKNTEQDIWSVFDYFKSEMPLQKHHITAWRINWELKSNNIMHLSRELNLGLDSFIFLDDKETECSEVKAVHPQVACFQVPSESKDIPAFLQHIWVFDRSTISKIDGLRTLYYQQEKQRKSLEKSAFSFEEFINQLDLKLDFFYLTEEYIERIVQLTRRTNQFNLSGRICSYSSLKKYLQSNESCLIVAARDKYGDYGVIACALYSIETQSMKLDNLLVSCRALGKQIEFKIWQQLCDIANKNKLEFIDVEFVKSDRNEPAANFLKALGSGWLESEPTHSFRYRINEIS